MSSDFHSRSIDFSLGWVFTLSDPQGAEQAAFDDRRIQFSTDGPIRILGIDNGAPENIQPFQADSIQTSAGRCLLVVQAETEAGEAAVTVQSDGLLHASIPLRLNKGT